VAREKNTSRAEARKRTREMTRAELLAAEAEEDEELGEATAQPEAPRQPMFKMPNVRADLAALPSIFRSRKLLWLPLVLFGVGFLVVLTFAGLPGDLQSIASMYVQFFFAPPALFSYFVAGFLAPRASYLVGFSVALVSAALWGVLLLGFGFIYVAEAGTVILLPEEFRQPAAMQFAVVNILYGTLAAALAAWYRDFLRGMQERGRARRAVKEVDERTRRREQRQEARRTAKQRPTP
jgi:hypothetical protein